MFNDILFKRDLQIGCCINNITTTRMSGQFSTYWSMTLNNPSEADMVLVRNPNDKYVRQFVYTSEVGQTGTPHIQASVRLHRNQTLSLMKRLYPRANFKACSTGEYVENSHNYAQKDDDTTAGQHTITNTNPPVTIDQAIKDVISRAVRANWDECHLFDLCILDSETEEGKWEPREDIRKRITVDMWAEFTRQQNLLVLTQKGYEKVFIGATYQRTMKTYWFLIMRRGLQTILTEQQEVIIPTLNTDEDEDSDGSQEESGLREAGGEDDEEVSGEDEGSDSSDGSQEDSEHDA